MDRMALRNVPAKPFYIYGETLQERPLNFAWLEDCDSFWPLTMENGRELLGEVYMYKQLLSHPMRTTKPGSASLFYLPVWPRASFEVGNIANDSCAIGREATHQGRMNAASRALEKAPSYVSRHGKPPGFDHMFASTHFSGKDKLRKVMYPLSKLLRYSIVGRETTYNPQSFSHLHQAVGRCVVEIPYLSNPHSFTLQRSPNATRPIWLSFRGSMDVCCEKHAHGPSIRNAIQRLINTTRYGAHSRQVLIVHVDRPWAAPREQRPTQAQLEDTLRQQYLRQAVELSSSEFYIVPAGDNSGGSRVFSAIAAGCIPVLISDTEAGAFASLVPYDKFMLRVHHASFVRNPLELLRRLDAVSESQKQMLRRELFRYLPEIIYEAPNSRVADNFLRAADFGCFQPKPTTRLGVVHRTNSNANKNAALEGTVALEDVPCHCLKGPPAYWWPQPQTFSFSRVPHHLNPVEVCGCFECGKLCE